MNLRKRKKVRFYIIIALIVMTSLVFAKMAMAGGNQTPKEEPFKWQWKLAEETTDAGAKYWCVFRTAPNGDAFVIAVRENGIVHRGRFVFYDPTLKVSLHFVSNLKEGQVVTPLRPLLHADGEVLEINRDSKFEGKGPGYFWKFDSFDAPTIKKLRTTKKLTIKYLVFLNWEREAEFNITNFGTAIDAAVKAASAPVVSKKPDHIKP